MAPHTSGQTKVSSIILARHGNAHCIVNDPYNTAYSTKDDERDLRVQGRTSVIDAADTDAYVAAAAISHQLPGMLCIKRKQETIFCRDLEMADCIVQLHCFTGCDANSGIYGKGKSSVYDKVAKSPVARRQLSHCGDTLDLGEKVEEELFKFT